MSSFREKLIQKVFRRERYVRTHVRSAKGGALDQYDKMKRENQVVDKSNKVERVVRKVKRRLDRAFGFAVEAKLPEMTSRRKSVNIARVVYAPNPTGHAIQLTLPVAAIMEREGYLKGDISIILTGALKGKNLAIVAIPDSTHILLEDVTTYVGPETNMVVRININGSKRSYK
jgi:hypothetical protein